jgi:L-ascorbate metabolism protein UlaG (beta-lactamase superfamily)
MIAGLSAASFAGLQTDTTKTNSGDLKITFIGHATLMFEYNGVVVHVDPWSKFGDYSAFPKADLILVTHEHPDHLDTAAIALLKKPKTSVVVSEACAGRVAGAVVMKNGDSQTIAGLRIEAVPAYNIVHKRDNGQPFHPKGPGNGYVVTFGNKRVYIGGDTENTPEMKTLKEIDIAFLPINLPYTMTPEMAADAARSFKPAIVYPYHFGETDTAAISAAFKSIAGCEVRIRKMK